MDNNKEPKEKLFSACLRDCLANDLSLTQRAFAQRIGLSQGLVSGWLTGKDLPTASSLAAVLEPFQADNQKLLLRHWINEAIGEEWLTLLTQESTLQDTRPTLDSLAAALPPATREALHIIVSLAIRSDDMRAHLQSWAKILSTSI